MRVAVGFVIGCLGALNLTCFLYPFLGRVFLLASKRVSWPCVLLKLAFATEKLAGILGFSWALCIAPNNSTRCECQSIHEEFRNASLAHLLNISFLVPINFLLHLHSKIDPCSCHPPIEEHPHGEEQSLSSAEYHPVPSMIFKSLGEKTEMLKVENLGTLKSYH